MRETIINLIIAIIGVAIVAVTTYIVPLIKASMTKEKLDTLAFWTQKAVACAEIIFNIPKSGEQKKAYVVDFLNKMFNSKKEVITEDELNVIIESAVKQLKDSSVVK